MKRIKFVQARNYTPVVKRDIRVVVIHVMESPESVSTAEDVANWFAGRSAPKASTHYNIDSNSIVQSVKDHDVAWCAPGKNHDGLQFEHAGRSAQTARDWSDPYSTKMLLLSAELVAKKCKQYGIPVRKLTPKQVRLGLKGLCGHVDVTRAYPDLGTHTDPGTSFPWDRYIRYVKWYKNHEGEGPPPGRG